MHAKSVGVVDGTIRPERSPYTVTVMSAYRVIHHCSEVGSSDLASTVVQTCDLLKCMSDGGWTTHKMTSVLMSSPSR